MCSLQAIPEASSIVIGVVRFLLLLCSSYFAVDLSPFRLLNSTMSKVVSADLWGWSFALNFSCFFHTMLSHSTAEISSVYSLELNTLDLDASFCDFCLHVQDWLE